MAEQIREHLWRLDIPLVGNPLKNLNSYLITGERSLLIDTGFRQEPCREAMEQQLTELGVNRDKMDIFLTHLHSDHTGLAPELIRPGCRVYISEIDGVELAADDEDSAYWQTLYADYVRDGFTQEEMENLWDTNPAQNARPKSWKDYTYLQDGDTLEYGGHTLHCILTPGHTPGHMCLYEAEAQWMFSGDHVLFHITPNICRWSWVADSLSDYLESLKKVGPMPTQLLLPAHRPQTGDLRQRTEELEAHHMHRIADALASIQAHPGMTAYEIAGQMSWQIRCRNWAEFPLKQKFFAVGEAMAHLDYLELRGKILRREENGKRVYYTVEP